MHKMLFKQNIDERTKIKEVLSGFPTMRKVVHYEQYKKELLGGAACPSSEKPAPFVSSLVLDMLAGMDQSIPKPAPDEKPTTDNQSLKMSEVDLETIGSFRRGKRNSFFAPPAKSPERFEV
jgi:hypothetical protein